LAKLSSVSASSTEVADDADLARLSRLEELYSEVRQVVAHDVRNPLAIISGQVQMMQLGLGNERSLEMIGDNLERVVQMLDELADRVTGVAGMLNERNSHG
jgi:signal transduction histidine kinase